MASALPLGERLARVDGVRIVGRLRGAARGSPAYERACRDMIGFVAGYGIFECLGKVYSVDRYGSLYTRVATDHAELFAAFTAPRLPRVCRVHGELEGSVSAETWDERSELVVTEGREWKGPFPSKRGKRGWD